MVINRINVDGYKNLENISLDLDPKMNIICGENAQGKTNLIEAIWLCSGCRSFRGTRDKDFIGFEKDSAEVEMTFTDAVRQQEIRFAVNKNSIKDKLVTLNGVKLPLLSRLFGSFKCVVFTPEDLNLIKGAPEVRRTFVDMSISQVKHSYVNALNKYNQALNQRNALLKSLSSGVGDASSLDIWDAQLAKAGAYISVLRYTYSRILNKYTSQLYAKITERREILDLFYRSTVFGKTLAGRTDYDGELAWEYEQKLKASLSNDLRAGFTTIGIHRDDLESYVNGMDVRYFGSQGQSRSVALSMKLAHARVLKAEQGEYPVILLDDVLSELDPKRQQFVLNNIDGMQVIITCCDSRSVTDMKEGRVFTMKNGKAGE